MAPNPRCPVYAVVSEPSNNVVSSRAMPRNVTVCGGGNGDGGGGNRKRKSVVYVTSSNRVFVGLRVDGSGDERRDDLRHFLIRYDGQWKRLIDVGGLNLAVSHRLILPIP